MLSGSVRLPSLPLASGLEGQSISICGGGGESGLNGM